MKTQLINTKTKKENLITLVLKKWVKSYINAMTKAFFPDTNTPASKNDVNRIFHK